MENDTNADFAQPEKKPVTKCVVLGCIAALVALTVLGGILNVGDHLFGVHPALGWVFYALIIVLVIVGIAVPLVEIARRPIFSLYQLRDKEGHARKRYCRLLADNLIASGTLSESEIKQVEEAVAADDDADDLLIEFFTQHIVPGVDDETKRAATTAFFVAAISRSPLISTVTMLSLCLDLVRAIVTRCGFRPTNAGLARLYIRVMLSALIVGGIEDADLGDAIGQLLGGGAGAHMGGLVLGAATEGLVSAFLVFRVGIITKRWLTAEDGPARMRQLRRESYKEALSQMRESGWLAEVTETLRSMAGTATAAAANTVANAAGSAVGNAASAVANAAHDITYPTTNAAASTAQGAYDTAQEMVDKFRHLFHRNS